MQTRRISFETGPIGPAGLKSRTRVPRTILHPHAARMISAQRACGIQGLRYSGACSPNQQRSMQHSMRLLLHVACRFCFTLQHNLVSTWSATTTTTTVGGATCLQLHIACAKAGLFSPGCTLIPSYTAKQPYGDPGFLFGSCQQTQPCVSDVRAGGPGLYADTASTTRLCIARITACTHACHDHVCARLLKPCVCFPRESDRLCRPQWWKCVFRTLEPARVLLWWLQLPMLCWRPYNPQGTLVQAPWRMPMNV